jgi:hypothetical protein
VRFELFEQNLLVMSDVHGGVTVSLQLFFFSSPSKYYIGGLFV